MLLKVFMILSTIAPGAVVCKSLRDSSSSCSGLCPPRRLRQTVGYRRRYEAFVFDCDGVLWGGSHSIEGSREFPDVEPYDMIQQ